MPSTPRLPSVDSPSTQSLHNLIATLLRIPLEQTEVFAVNSEGDAIVVLCPKIETQTPYCTRTNVHGDDETEHASHSHDYVPSGTRHMDVDGFSRQEGDDMRFPRMLALELKSKLVDLGGAAEILGVVAPDVLRCLGPLMCGQDASVLD
jgi:hypothetical protein